MIKGSTEGINLGNFDTVGSRISKRGGAPGNYYTINYGAFLLSL